MADAMAVAQADTILFHLGYTLPGMLAHKWSWIRWLTGLFYWG
jgi:hypothetical protein